MERSWLTPILAADLKPLLISNNLEVDMSNAWQNYIKQDTENINIADRLFNHIFKEEETKMCTKIHCPIIKKSL